MPRSNDLHRTTARRGPVRSRRQAGSCRWLARRTVMTVGAMVVMALAAPATAWAWWSATANAPTVTASTIAITPVMGTPKCSPSTNLRNDPVVVSWSAPTLPAGASVAYTVTFTSSQGTKTFAPSPANGTSVSVTADEVGTTVAQQTAVQTITVAAAVTFASGVVWTSPSSAAVTAQGQQSTILGFPTGLVDFRC